MKNFISRITNSARQFTALDFAIFKIYLCSIGILVGVYFYNFFAQYLSAVWIVAIITCVVILTKLVRHYIRANARK